MQASSKQARLEERMNTFWLTVDTITIVIFCGAIAVFL